MTIVHNATTLTEHSYTLPPRDAVLAAFALSTMRDANSLGWEKRFGHLVKRVPNGWVAGDWWARDVAQKDT